MFSFQSDVLFVGAQRDRLVLFDAFEFQAQAVEPAARRVGHGQIRISIDNGLEGLPGDR